MAKYKQPEYVQARESKPSDLAKHLRSCRPKKRGTQAHRGSMASIRTDSYKGYDIRVETSYKISVDGKPLSGHVDLTNSGQIHYHPLPNLSAASAVEMVHAIIDSFPDEFGPRKAAQGRKKTKRKTKKKTTKKRTSTARKKKGR